MIQTNKPNKLIESHKKNTRNEIYYRNRKVKTKVIVYKHTQNENHSPKIKEI